VTFPYMNTLKEGIEDSLKHRFKNLLDKSTRLGERAIVAHVCLPVFKTRLVAEEDRGEIQNLLMKYAKRCKHDESPAGPSTSSESAMNADEEFFELSAPLSAPADSVDTVLLEVLQYLEDQSKEMSSLQQFPLVKKLFLRPNCILPSSAPVERLFSFASLILTSKRNRLSDKNFEKMLLLKAFLKSEK